MIESTKKNISLIMLALLAGCSTKTEKTLDLVPVNFSTLPHFEKDDLEKALPALQKSCEMMMKSPSKTYLAKNGRRPMNDWMPFCRCIVNLRNPTSKAVKKVLTQYLTPYKAYCDGEDEGVFTGYYEPLLYGSKKKHGKYQTPLYKKPNGSLATLTRSQIIQGALKNKNLELLYVDDPIEAFFLQIQGSGRVKLDDGTIVRLGYASGNKQPYTPIGATLVEKGYLVKGRDKVTMQTIKKWLKNNPSKAESIMSSNQSYVFFRYLKNTEGPIGSQQVPLTANRSLAIDAKYISLGTPIWLDIEDSTLGKARKLVVAQDTGGAIKGPIRGDYFWGFGHNAGEKAGIMNAKGGYYLLLPKA